MTDDDRFDPTETELRRRFGALAAVPTDADPVLDSMRPRLRRARTRSRAMVSGGAVLAVVAAVVVGASLIGSGDGSVHTPPATHATIPEPGPSPTTTAPPTPSVTGADGAGADPSAAAGSGSGPETTAPGGGSSTGTGGAPTGAPAPGEDHTYTSAGGSIVVRLSGGAVSLVSSSATAGYTAQVHDDGPTRVEVRFDNGPTEWRIRVDLVNGALVPEITQH